jgi:simple sugar transport system permease protein
MEINLIIGLSTLAIIKAAPLVFGALCGLLGERSGVINIGIEGMMLISAFTTFLGSALFNQWTGGIFPTNLSLLIGLFCGITSGALIAALHAVLSIHYKIDQVISGTVINLLAVGLTNYIANVYIDPTHLSGVGVFPTIPIPILSEIPIVGPILFSHQPMIYLMFIMVIFMQYLVFHTPMGLRMRSVGEHPRSADTVGIDVNRTRYVNVILGGVFAGLGGAIMVLESVGRFQKLMTSGRGFIALAALIFGGWTSTGALGSALLFGFSEALGVRLQFGDLNHIKVIVIVSGLVILGLGIFLLIKKIIEKEINIKKYIFISILIVLGTIIMIGSKYVKFPSFSIPIEFLGLLPYLLTIFVLTGFVRRAKGPAAAGIPYEKQ